MVVLKLAIVLISEEIAGYTAEPDMTASVYYMLSGAWTRLSTASCFARVLWAAQHNKKRAAQQSAGASRRLAV